MKCKNLRDVKENAVGILATIANPNQMTIEQTKEIEEMALEILEYCKEKQPQPRDEANQSVEVSDAEIEAEARELAELLAKDIVHQRWYKAGFRACGKWLRDKQ